MTRVMSPHIRYQIIYIKGCVWEESDSSACLSDTTAVITSHHGMENNLILDVLSSYYYSRYTLSGILADDTLAFLVKHDHLSVELGYITAAQLVLILHIRGVRFR